MKHEYDLFERFTDGSSLWRDSASGFDTTRLRLQELARRSGNRFYAIDLMTGKILTFNSGFDAHGFSTPLKMERRSNSQVA
jgi:hypothetical protein